MSPRKQVTYSSHPNRAARAAHARAAKQFQTYDVSGIRPKPNYKPMVVLVVALIVLVIIIIGVVRGCTQGSSRPLLQEGNEVTVVIEQGASANSIGSLLEEYGLVSRASEFTDEVNRENAAANLKPGSYTFVGGTSAADLVAQISAGPQHETVTVPEGKTARATAQLVDAATDGRISENDFMGRVNDAASYQADYEFLQGSDNIYDNSLEGYLFPKTYEITPDDTADSLVRKMLDQFKSETANIDYSYAESRNLTKYDVLILASIVERESTEKVRPQVASVFYNRLSGGMQLQSDATTAYLVNGDPTPEDLENTKENPYNTQYNYGLPPGPICSPSVESIKAAANPAETNYLYFFFEPDSEGKMQYYFSETYDEHLAAIEGNGIAVDFGTSSSTSSGSSNSASSSSASNGTGDTGDSAASTE